MFTSLSRTKQKAPEIHVISEASLPRETPTPAAREESVAVYPYGGQAPVERTAPRATSRKQAPAAAKTGQARSEKLAARV